MVKTHEKSVPDPLVLIIGAGHAGVATAAALRKYGHVGKIVMVGDEESLPYHRPPISKAYLHGDSAPDLLRGEDFYGQNDIELFLGRSITSLDLKDHKATLDNGESLRFSDVVLATGARARTLPMQLPERGCWSLRTHQDAQRFRSILTSAARIVIIGGGFVGLETAAAARKHGCEVTIIERESRLLQRVASTAISEALTLRHREEGVEIRVGADVQEIIADDIGDVKAVLLADGTEIPCDAVVIGVGAEPRDELLRDLGADCHGGVTVDTSCRTGLDRVYAVGDVTRREVSGYPGSHRLESIPNTTEQANQAAAAITGREAPAPEVPWFWSDQYEQKLKIAGLLVGVSKTVVRGSPQSKSFAAYHFNDSGSLVAVEAMNAAGDFMIGKKWIAEKVVPSVEKLSDLSVPLRSLLPA